MKSLLRQMAYQLGSKRIDESGIESERITVCENDLRYFTLSTNTIISFEYNGGLHYFRECPKLLPFRDHCLSSVDEFFDSLRRLGISEDHFKQEIPIPICFEEEIIERFRKDIDRRRQEPSFFTAMANADAAAKQHGFSIWDNQEYDTAFVERLGLDGIPEELLEIAVLFMWYMRSTASSYKTLRVVRGKRYSYFNAAKSIASAVVAEEMGCASLISDARFVTLETDTGRSMFGVLSRAALGERMADACVSPSGALQRELLTLHALDVIVHQPDHGPNNYNVFSHGDGCQVCAFDNDNPYTFFPFFDVRRSLAGCSPLVGADGMVARPFFDKDAAQRIHTIDVRRLKKRLKPYLNGLQTAALVRRIKKLDQAICKTQTHRQFLLESTAFCDDTVCRELDGSYGVTYLSKAVNRNIKEKIV